MKLFKSVFLIVICGLFILSGPALAAPPTIITPEELYPGLTGYGRTVVSGTQVETFYAEVVGVMKNSGSTGGDLILVRVSGDVIRRTGGIAQGMSGSPVFFDGRLAGAVAFGWSLADPHLCMLTPIGEMLKISDNMREDLAQAQKEKEEQAKKQAREDERHLAELKKEAVKASAIEDDTVKPDKTDKKGPPAGDSAQQPGALPDTLSPKATALMARGFSEQGLAIIRDGLKDYDVVPYNVGQAPAALNDLPLEPGSAVSVELIRGDISLGVLGTATWIDGDEVLAFGHPFTRMGKVSYFLSNAWTFTTVSSINNSFRVGAPGKLLGIALQDRGSGLAGKLNLYPEVIPVFITVKDKQSGRSNSLAVQIIKNELFASYLTQAAVVSAVDRTIDRRSGGTARVNFAVSSADLPDGRVMIRENMFYSLAGISEILASELTSGINLLSRNRFQPVDLADIKVDVEISEERSTAAIISAHPLVDKARPGDIIGIEVKLQPYRGESVTKIVPFTIPDDQQPGEMLLLVRGGISLASLQAAVNQQKALETALLLRADRGKTKTFADEIDEFNKRDRNNDIVVDLIIGNKLPPKPDKTEKAADEQAAQEKQLNEFVQGTEYKTNTPAEYIITGETSATIRIFDQEP